MASTAVIWFVDSTKGGYLMMSKVQRKGVIAPSEIKDDNTIDIKEKEDNGHDNLALEDTSSIYKGTKL